MARSSSPRGERVAHAAVGSGPSWAALALVSLCALSSAHCGSPGKFVWIADVPPQPVAPDYTIQEGDLIEIRVFNQEPLSTRARVRTDGKISVPILGDVDVHGRRPSDLKPELEARLKDYVNAPNVTVSLQESHPITIAVLGEVSHQGVFPIDPHATLADVLALAGGLNDFASRDHLFVVRAGPPPLRVRFTYEDVSRGNPSALAFALRQGDVIVVE